MKTKKLFSLSLSVFLLAVAFMPMGAQAARCTTDLDRDGYYVGAAGSCEEAIGQKGFEPQICDCPIIKEGEDCGGAALTFDEVSNLFDPSKIKITQRGSSFNPNIADAPGDGIDNNCDGEDSALTNDIGTDVPGLIQKGVKFLGQLVAGVSTLFLIWGAIMYSSASGEEEKTRKARKTMIGAVVGLIIGFLAANFIGIIIGQVA